MVSSTSCKAESGEPSSYQQIEQALSRVASRPGEDTREADLGAKELFMQDSGAQSKPSSTTEKGEKPRNQDGSEDKSRELNGTPVSDRHSADQCAPGSDEAGASIKAQSNTKHSGKGSDQRTLASASKVASSETVKAANESKERVSQIGGSEGRSKQNDASLESVGMSSSEIPGPPVVIHAQLPTGQLNPRAAPGLSAGHGSRSKSPSLRRGKWTMEEEAYVARVIQDFNSGFLNAPAGTTLRSYLSEKLQCDPMRITKKFTGDACIGKRVFHPAVRSAANASSIDKAQAELDALERRWRRRLEMQQRESAKKAAASAAAANSPGQGDHLQQHAVAQAASWLDRANAILRGSKPAVGDHGVGESTGSGDYAAHSFDSMPSNEIENQMKEVQRLIYEGPTIKKTTAGLQTGSRHGVAGPLRSTQGSVMEQGLSAEPADKRMRTATNSGAEDAEALVGFLRSVRAAASQEST